MLHRSILDLAPRSQQSNIQIGLVSAGLLLTTLAVYYSGGTHTAVPHLLYLPVTAAALCFGIRGGVLAGVAAGVLVGPIMPLNVDAGIGQEPINWLIRLGMFTTVGAFVGLISMQRLRRIEALAQLNAESVSAFVRTIDAKCTHTARHSENVARYALSIGEDLGLDSARLDRLRWSALLHDIGKLRIPDDVLNKPGRLDQREWELVMRHPTDSEHILKDIKHFQPYLPAIRHHHERVDGNGYPDGLGDSAIPLEARILAVADAYDAMTTDRPYRPALSQRDALEELRAGSGTQFDPVVVEALERVSAAAPLPEEPPLAVHPRWAGNAARASAYANTHERSSAD